jgi:hypothetical protein
MVLLLADGLRSYVYDVDQNSLSTPTYGTISGERKVYTAENLGNEYKIIDIVNELDFELA